MNIEELMKYMLNLFDNTSTKLKNEYEKLSEVDLELSDLDHFLENHSLKAYDLARISKIRRLKLKERREIKNNIEIIETVKKFTDKYNNKLITGDIIQNLKEQENILNRQANPVYKYRTTIVEKIKK